jgi:hypothetical protein
MNNYKMEGAVTEWEEGSEELTRRGRYTMLNIQG